MAATWKRFPTESGDYNCTTEGPAQNTRSATIRTHSLTRESVDMDTAMPRVTPAAPGNSDDAAGTDSNLRNDTTTGGDIVAAIGEMVDRLDKVAVNTARPTYTVKAFGGAGEDVVAWLANFERYARLQNLVGNQCADAFAFHVSGIAETWYATLPDSLQTEWPALKEACRQRFAISQHGRWRQERDLYTLRQQPGQDVASFTAVVLKAARGLEMTQAQLVRLVLGGLHTTVTPFVEITQPTTVDELLQCPAARNGMSAPAYDIQHPSFIISIAQHKNI